MGIAIGIIVMILLIGGSSTPPVKRAQSAAKTGAGIGLFWLVVFVLGAMALSHLH